MKKTKIIGLLLPLLSLGLAGCGDDNTGENKNYSKNATHHWIEDVADSRGEHEFEDSPEDSVAATCSAPGKTAQKCKVCGYTKTTDVAKLKHNYVVDEAASTASTCKDAGKKVEKCTLCGDVKEKTLSLANHTYVVDTAASSESTCKVAGKKVEKCSVCGNVKETTLSLAEHSYVEDTSQAAAPTCSQVGKKVEKCSVCDNVKETTIPKTAHTLGAGTAKTEDGKTYYEYECSTCHNKVESRVKISDAELIKGSMGTSGNDKGKLSTDPGVAAWTFQLPAGEYDVYFDMNYSSSGEGKTLSERGVKVTLNGEDVTFDNTVSDDVIGTSTSEFKSVTFCSITATGGGDVITIQNPYYRYVFDYDNGYVSFLPKPVVA